MTKEQAQAIVDEMQTIIAGEKEIHPLFNGVEGTHDMYCHHVEAVLHTMLPGIDFASALEAFQLIYEFGRANGFADAVLEQAVTSFVLENIA